MSNELETVLASLGQAINQKIISAPAPALDIHDRSISGNKLNGGTYANFASTGIKDKATYAGAPILTIENDKIVNDAIAVNTVLNPLTIKGNLTEFKDSLIYLVEYNNREPLILDSSKVTDDNVVLEG